MSIRILSRTNALLTAALLLESMGFSGLAHAQEKPALPATGAATAAPAPIRVACVGDSITFGSGTSNPQTQSYPAQLARILGVGYTVGDFGVGGATLLDAGDKPYRKQRAYRDALGFQADIVVILLGTNDSKPQNWMFKDRFVPDYESLIETFTRLTPRPHIYVGYPIVVVGQGNYGINEPGVEEAMRLIDRIAADEKVTVIDLHATLIGRDKLIPDRVHPNDDGAGLMAKMVYQTLTGKPLNGPIPAPPVSPVGAAGKPVVIPGPPLSVSPATPVPPAPAPAP